MAVEPKRGCGYRKVGGLYLVGGQLSSPCGKLPLELHVCPTCNAGVKQTRGWTWVDPRPIFATKGCELPLACLGCPVGYAGTLERAGLIWIGGAFYPEPADFMAEARALGVSRRITAVPRGFKLGEDWVLIAHPKAIVRAPVTTEELAELEVPDGQQGILDGAPEHARIYRKGILCAFKPLAIEKIVTESEAKDGAAMAALQEKGITPVAVPDDDKDHQGTVYEVDDSQVPDHNQATQEE